MSMAPDPAHFARAVTELGEKRVVVARGPIFNAQGLKVIDAGVVVDARLYDRLAGHQLKSPLAESLGSEPSVTGPALRDAGLALCRHEPLFGAMAAAPRLRDILGDELLLVPLPESVAFQLTLMRETRPDMWMHALRSAVTAGWLVHRQGGSRHDVRMLAAAGLVHDLGMLHLDPVLGQPEIELNGDQRRQLYSHPLVSVMLLERHHEYPREMLRAVLEHHEALDGSGYPRNVTGAGLSPWGRVLSLMEMVTAMPVPRLSLALRLNRQRYDAALVQEVSALLPALAQGPVPTPAGDPVLELAAIETLLARWPASAPAGLSAERVAVVAEVGAQANQVVRHLVAAGASSAQLGMLGAAGLDDGLRVELDLIVREMAWQLRTVTRQARRRWRVVGGEDRPAWLQDWLDEAEALCARHLSA